MELAIGIGYLIFVGLLFYLTVIGVSRLVEYLQEAQAEARRKQEEAEKDIWFGEMHCACGYCWTSRKSTPPARCPRCNSTNITAELGR